MRIGQIKNTCPQCHSENIKLVDYMGIACTVCNDCGYDERSLYEVYPSERTSQSAKGKFTPYKTGGGRRAQKR